MYDVAHRESSLRLDVLKKWKLDSKIFVETGSNTGKGIEVALMANFEKIISFDVEEKFINFCRKKFSKFDNVDLILGDSSQCLLENIKNVNQKLLFWLDGHADYSIPLLKELEQIKNLNKKDHIIMIDDVRMFEHPLWNGLKQKDVINKIIEINKNYQFSYEDSANGKRDILIAHF